MITPMNTPDDFVGIRVGDLTQNQIDALEDVWPAAYDVVTNLLKKVHNPGIFKNHPDFDKHLGRLVWERA